MRSQLNTVLILTLPANSGEYGIWGKVSKYFIPGKVPSDTESILSLYSKVAWAAWLYSNAAEGVADLWNFSLVLGSDFSGILSTDITENLSGKERYVTHRSFCDGVIVSSLKP